MSLNSELLTHYKNQCRDFTGYCKSGARIFIISEKIHWLKMTEKQNIKSVFTSPHM